jgi:HSP20 family molecular chaperone IbpA
MGKHYTSIHTLHQHIEDPYYGLDKQPSHKGVAIPKFDVREDANAFYLDGDVPGVSEPSQIFTEVIDSLTLIIRGTVKPKEGSENAKIPEQHGRFLKATTEVQRIPTNPYSVNEEAAKAAGAAPKEGEKGMIWKLKERPVGRFERSFTFPSHFKFASMETKVEAGVLSIKLLKDHQADKEADAKLEIATEYPLRV